LGAIAIATAVSEFEKPVSKNRTQIGAPLGESLTTRISDGAWMVLDLWRPRYTLPAESLVAAPTAA
jgi:hypothetical protein